MIIWTSGTTGLPKGAWFDHANLRAAASTAGIMTRPFDRRLVSTPLAHAGYMAKLWEQLAWATTLVLSPVPWTASAMLRLLVAERITVAGGVPTQWAKLLELPELDSCGSQRPAARRCRDRANPARSGGTGGGAVRVPAHRPLCDDRVPLDHRDPAGRSSRRPLSDGGPTAGGRRGFDPRRRGRGMSPRRRGSHSRPGCLRDAGVLGRAAWLTSEVLDRDGWLRSSDLGRFDEDGNIVLAGRIDDLYIRGGYKVHPLEVENVMLEHPAVEEVAVIGIPAPVLGEMGVAFVVPAPGAEAPTCDELRQWCIQRLADYKAPDRIVVTDALPRTPMMKIDRLRAPVTAVTPAVGAVGDLGCYVVPGGVGD